MANNEVKKVIIIGGGVGGIMTAIALKQRLGFHNFTIYEHADGIGGTWHHNTYPGAACDTHTLWYSLSSDLRPTWNKTHLSQRELLAYWEELVEKYQVTDHIQLNSKVTGVVWDGKRGVYQVTVERRGGVPDVVVDKAHAVISAVGVLNVPSYPQEFNKARDQFKGPWFHSARWDHSVDLKGKRVGVIGSGSSACQIVANISEDPSVSVVNFCRTPNWFFPDPRLPIPTFVTWLFKYVPGLMRSVRWVLFCAFEFLYTLLILSGKTWWWKAFLAHHIKSNTPKKYHDRLIPKHDGGCKRYVIDPGYLKSLHRENVDVNFDGIKEINETSVITKTGQDLNVDVIVEATGFVADKYPVVVKGEGGKSIQEYFDENEGPTAYRGTTVPGFPNFFMLYGPNTNTGHASVIFTEECQVTYILQLLKPIVNHQVSTFTVTPLATDRWNTYIQSKLSTSVWATGGCSSWYRVGKTDTGKLTAVWPGFVTSFWWQLRKPVWDDYKVEGGEAWLKERKKGGKVGVIVGWTVLGIMVGAGWYWDVIRKMSGLAIGGTF